MRAYVLTYHIVHVNLNDQWLPFNFPFYNCLFFMAVLGLHAVMVHGLLVVATLAVEAGFQSARA